MTSKIAAIVLFLIAALSTSAFAGMSIVNEMFDQYATDGDFNAAWRPDNGDGVDDPLIDPLEAGLLVPDNAQFATPPNDNPPGLEGKGINALTGINEWRGSEFSLVPTAEESIRFGGDMFVDAVEGNWRHSIGLRNDTVDRSPDFGLQAGLNFLELGLWNATACNPTAEPCDLANPDDPNIIASTQIAHRLVLFDSSTLGNVTRPVADFANGTFEMETLPLTQTPNWQYFVLHPDFDLAVNGGDEDGEVNLNDIGEGWHTYSSTVTDTEITFELDLFRNGINEITGLPGPDSWVTYEVQLADDPENPGTVASFTSLRIGPPSGVSGNAEVVFDNVFLETIDVMPPGVVGDYNGDGSVNAADYTVWRGTLGQSVGIGEGADGDRDGEIGPGDYLVWKDNYGLTVGSGASAIPEPATTMLLIVGLGSALLYGRKRMRIHR